MKDFTAKKIYLLKSRNYQRQKAWSRLCEKRFFSKTFTYIFI